MSEQKKLLIISQVYVPDPAAVGQYMHDAAVEMVRRGWQVIVYTACRGYDNPTNKYPKRELINGVMVKRFPLSSFGKRLLLLRLLAAALFIFQAVLHGLRIRGLNKILVSTSPPMASLAAMAIAAVKKVNFIYWVMDINPDQAIALGMINKKSLTARLFNRLNRLFLGYAEGIITLDEDMKKRLQQKLAVGKKIFVLPPWPLQEHLIQPKDKKNYFRQKHGFNNKFIFMYSGNHSLAHPLNTFFEAALALQEEEKVQFIFIGGGLGKAALDSFLVKERPKNILSLPYQPLAETGSSLAAADVHLISMGEEMVGVVHPSKIYGAMAVGRPLLLLGPSHSHAGKLIKEHGLGWQVEHGDVKGMIELIRQISVLPADQLADMGFKSRTMVEDKFNRLALLQRFADIITGDN